MTESENTERWGEWEPTERRFITLSQKHSRRGFLAKTAMLMLMLTGVAVAEHKVQPVKEVEATDLCGQATWCGLSGKPCPNCGGTSGTCPSSAPIIAQGSWTICCEALQGLLQYHIQSMQSRWVLQRKST